VAPSEAGRIEKLIREDEGRQTDALSKAAAQCDQPRQKKLRMPKEKKKSKKSTQVRDLKPRKDPKGGPHIGMGARPGLSTATKLR